MVGNQSKMTLVQAAQLKELLKRKLKLFRKVIMKEPHSTYSQTEASLIPLSCALIRLNGLN